VLRRAGASDEPRAYGATLRTSPEARARIAEFVARRRSRATPREE